MAVQGVTPEQNPAYQPARSLLSLTKARDGQEFPAGRKWTSGPFWMHGT
jgi:hypothetical protein